MRQSYENNKRRIQTFKLTADVKENNGMVHHFADGYEYVEIGGIKWATCNIGANEKHFSFNDYKFGNYNNLLKYSYDDGLDTLEACDDAATKNMGENWRMPTKDEFCSLLSATTNEWTRVNGVSGRLFTDKTDSFKKLFFPSVGYCCSGSVYYMGSYGLYWSSSLYALDAINGCNLTFSSVDCYVSIYGGRNIGFPIRGVVK